MSKEVPTSEVRSAPPTPRPPVSAPPSQMHSPAPSRSSPLRTMVSPIASPVGKAVASLRGYLEEATASEVRSAPPTPRPASGTPSQAHSPAPGRSPLRAMVTPIASPVRKAVASVKGYLEEVGHITTLHDPRDAWLPITASQSGNSYYAAFHSLSSGIGFQALVLPFAFVSLGWTWAIICLTLAFAWQLYTLRLLVNLHEPVAGGIRYSRYMHLATTVFGDKWGKTLALIPTMYLSAGICTVLIIIGGGSMKTLFSIACASGCQAPTLTTVEWYVVFTCVAVVLSQLPSLNSIAGVSLVAGTAAVAYCTMIWVVSVAKGPVAGASHDPVEPTGDVDRTIAVLNGLGIIAFAFRGHNLVLEIQGTMPSTLKHPSHVPMWKGVKFAYLVVALCLYPIAIGGFWAYGNQMPENGMLTALYKFHGEDTSRLVVGLATLLVIVNCLTTFQIYAMPVFDHMEAGYVHRKNRPCPWWLRAGLRAFFGATNLLIAVAFPFLSQLAALMGGIALPVTLAYPCFMWLSIMKPRRGSKMWCVNWALGCLGMVLSFVLIVGNLWGLVLTGMHVQFFKPE